MRFTSFRYIYFTSFSELPPQRINFQISLHGNECLASEVIVRFGGAIMYKHIAKPLETNLTALNIQEKLVRAACTFKQFMMVDLHLSNVSHIDDRLPRSHLTFSWFTLLHYVRVCYHTRFFFNLFFFGHKVYPTQ